jgi:Ser/Thr protein kinase RdoA (MazF antagonist)
VDRQNNRHWGEEAAWALASYGISGAKFLEIDSGLINLTVEVLEETGNRFILQKVSGIFKPSVNKKIAEVTAHLRKCGVFCPKIISTKNHENYCERNGNVWRLYEYIPGYSKTVFTSPEEAYSAGKALAEFHRGLENFDIRLLENDRSPIHDLRLHLNELDKTLSRSTSHRLYSQCCALSKRIELLASTIPDFDPGPLIVAHGDPKVSNILFSAKLHSVVCFIDLDTVGLMPHALELGDAMRSWCNPFPEDSSSAFFNIELYDAALEGYNLVSADFGLEESILPATLQIYVELASRFLTDVIRESYFGWDDKNYESAASHNLARASAQVLAAESLAVHISNN